MNSKPNNYLFKREVIALLRCMHTLSLMKVFFFLLLFLQQPQSALLYLTAPHDLLVHFTATVQFCAQVLIVYFDFTWILFQMIVSSHSAS